MELEPTVIFAFYFPFAFLWLINLAFVSIHKKLRNRKVYFSLLCISIIFLLICVSQIESGWTRSNKTMAFGPIMLISYLILYKLFDNIVQIVLKRPMYFTSRLNRRLDEYESKEATAIEIILQPAILVLSMVVYWKLSEYIVELWM